MSKQNVASVMNLKLQIFSCSFVIKTVKNKLKMNDDDDSPLKYCR